MTISNINIELIFKYFQNLNLISVIDLLIALFITWQVLNFLSKTRGLQIAKGLVLLYIGRLAGSLFSLHLASELFDTISTLLLISLPIVFQREIRIMLESFGRMSLFKKNSLEHIRTITEIKESLEIFSKEKVGALIILEQTTPLDEFTVNAIKLGASEISNELLECIFKNQSPLHDGAVLIRQNKMVAAKCILPLTENNQTNSQLGTRHRAAIGISEVSDAIAIVVSEETGSISIANKGELRKVDNIKKIESILMDMTTKKHLAK